MGSDEVAVFALGAVVLISIHAPRMGSDRQPLERRQHPPQDFNPRSPDGERPLRIGQRGRPARISIHAPRMGSDTCRCPRSSWSAHFNPRSPDGERRMQGVPMTDACVISIHAPRMGSDSRRGLFSCPPHRFQSTLPGWGATTPAKCCTTELLNFNPRSPDGERPRKWTSSPTIWAKSSIFNTDCIADRR